MNKGVLHTILKASEKKNQLVSVLIDPDCQNFGQLEKLIFLCNQKPVDFILVGGSLLSHGNTDETILFIKERTKIPIIIFPGTTHQISEKADAIFLLSLVSGRNADLLIGKHVESSFRLKSSGLEILPTAYLLVDGGRPTTASYISFTQALPNDKPMLAAATALAAEQLGFKIIYLDSGSGALNPVTAEMIKQVKINTSLPIIVGGGLKNKTDIKNAFDAGANMIVIGNALEINPDLLNEFF